MPDCNAYTLRPKSARWQTGAALLLASLASAAQAGSPGWELVYNAPVETSLAVNDLRPAEEVWQSLFDHAGQKIDLAAFYISGKPGSRLNKTLEHLRAAGERGVKIRVLMEEKGAGMSAPETIAMLKAIPNLTFSQIPFGRLTGGIQHAKYLVVDSKDAWVGSQNLDWRALEHIHETGLLIHDEKVVQQVQSLFDHDWQLQARLAADQKVIPDNIQPLPFVDAPGIQLVASPKSWNPAGIPDSEQALTTLLNSARKQVNIMVMDYTPLAYGHGPVRQYYPLIDNAVRAAAAHGATINLMVADWNLHQPALSYLKSLAMLPRINIRYVHIPEASSGPVPYARVLHSKVMTLDGSHSWVGTSNWSGGYLDNSRNLEIVVKDTALTLRLDRLFNQLWQSDYAHQLGPDTQPVSEAPGA